MFAVRSGRLATAAAGCALLAGCVLEGGPLDPTGRPFVEGRWDIEARPVFSSCQGARDEPFAARMIQNGDLIQLVVDVVGFGPVRYDGRVRRDGGFFLDQSTVFPREGIRDDSSVEGRFRDGGRSLRATEVEVVTVLSTGRSCRVEWRWFGRR